MKAIRIHEFGKPEVLRYEEVAKPEPGAGEVLIRVHAAGINPVEAYIRAGTYPLQPGLPYTPGGDAGGVVEAVGHGALSFKPGDRVYTSGSITGTYAESTLCKEKDVHPLPPNTSFEGGAALGVPYGTAYRALFLIAQAKSGEFVLVHGGTGGVGIACIQLARAAGLKIIATGGTEKGRALIADQGAHHVLDHRASGYLDKIRSITANGVDIVLEMLANVNLANDLGILGRNGRVIVIGSRGPVQIDPRQLMSNDASVRGMTLRNAGEAELKEIHAALIQGLESGALSPVIGKKFSLSEAALSHDAIMEGSAHGKIVLVS